MNINIESMKLSEDELELVSGGKVNWEEMKDKALDDLLLSIPGFGLFWTFWRKKSKKSQG